MDEQRINILAKKWRDGTATEAEKEEFEHWYRSFDDAEEEILHEEDQDALGRKMYRYISMRKKEGSPSSGPGRWTKGAWRVAAAAAVLAGLALVFYLWKDQQPAAREQLVRLENDLVPGGNRATLTLGNGRTIVLDQLEEGELAVQAGVSVFKVDSGSLAYRTGEHPGERTYNTLSTPRGGQYRLILPDSTLVWLNAASSITYPTAFEKEERRVTITGEAYFEVRHDKARPFRVEMNIPGRTGQVVEVLGTRFNINAYADESGVRTTLLDGSVRVTPLSGRNMPSGKAQLLRPGQQSLLRQGALSVHEADIASAVAWKNGLFQFRDTGLREVMRQLARWYNVEVVYEGNVPDRSFSGKIYRDLNASQVLDILRFTNVHFRIEGEKIIVSP